MSKNLQYPFPKLPEGLNQQEKRAEIRRRLKVAQELGLIGRPRNRGSTK